MNITFLGGRAGRVETSQPNHRKPTATELETLKSDKFKLKKRGNILFVDEFIGNSLTANLYRDIYRVE